MAKVFIKVSKQEPDSGKPENKPPKIKVRVKSQDPVQAYNAYEKDIDTNLPIYDKNARDFLTYYLNSPLYKQRLIKQGYDKPEDAIRLRLANLGVTPTVKKLTDTSEYDPPTQKVNISPYDYLSNKYLKPKSVVVHELSHVAGAMEPGTPKIPFPMTLSEKEANEIYNRNRLSTLDASKLTDEQRALLSHDVSPHENKADLDTLRYLLYQDGLYDAGKQNFSKEMLQKAKQKYGSDGMVKRLFNYFSDDDIIWMMNNIAKNSNINSTNNAV